MPTGYTAQIEKGIGFNEFVMSCARAFGALVLMRDDPADAEIPQSFSPLDYHAKELQRAQERLSKAKTASDGECAASASDEYTTMKLAHDERITQADSLRRKYDQMLADVRAWTPPSSDHVELKRFMEEQIVRSIEFDCDTRYYTEHAPKSLSAKQWREKEIVEALREVAYHAKEQRTEIERTESRNRWVRQLRESLNQAAGQREVSA